MNDRLPFTRDLVLIGGGHTHALVLRKWGMSPLPGVRVTVINPGPTALYSGMLPGFVAGHYTRDDLDIDLIRLARFAGARMVIGTASGIDRDARLIEVPGRPPIGYDLASVDVGVTSRITNIPGFADHAVPAKPLGRFVQRWEDFSASPGRARIAVIGGGIAGCELALAMHFALRARGMDAQVTVIDRAEIGQELPARKRRALLAAMQRNKVALVAGAQVSQIDAGMVHLTGRRPIEADLIVGAAGACAHPWLRKTGLTLKGGFITVSPTLQSSDPAIFAAGDCADLAYAPRPKAGVFAVRAAPVLYDNLVAGLSGGSMRAFAPQKNYLKLISLGAKRALGHRFGVCVQGAAVWRLKDRIDQRFMRKFRELPSMPPPTMPKRHALGMSEALGPKPLCGGCGAKVGRGVLGATLTRLPATARADVLSLPGDDAATLQFAGTRQVLTTDHLRAFTDDPVVMARITAVHALGDIWAMGAAPQAALASVTLPRLSPALQARTLDEIMISANEIMTQAGAVIVGGHSTVGAELTIGFTVTGLCDKAQITLSGAQVGDALILTKPLGTGVILAAEMQRAARGAWVAAALASMARPQAEAAQVLTEANAMTDVTGFGLAGHLLGICEASSVGACLTLRDIPVLQGALELASEGHRSTLFGDNAALVPGLAQDPLTELLFDPQTAGGLMAAVAPNAAQSVLARLRALGFPAAQIGTVTENVGQITVS